MRVANRLTLALGLTLVLVGPANAQRNLNRTRFTDPAVLIQNKNVQDYLDLSDSAREAILQIPILIRQVASDDHKAIMEEKDSAKREKLKEAVRRRTLAEGIKQLQKHLTPEQLSRIQQLALQISDFQAFERDDVKEALRITAEQQSKLNAIIAAGRDGMTNAIAGEKPDGGGNLEMMWQKSKPVRKKAMEQSLAVLTREQRTKWSSMVGETFDFALERPGKDLLPREGIAGATAAQKADPEWIRAKVEEWMPKPKEKAFDQIGWLTQLREATRLAREHNRGVFIFVVDGILGTGRC